MRLVALYKCYMLEPLPIDHSLKFSVKKNKTRCPRANVFEHANISSLLAFPFMHNFNERLGLLLFRWKFAETLPAKVRWKIHAPPSTIRQRNRSLATRKTFFVASCTPRSHQAVQLAWCSFVVVSIRNDGDLEPVYIWLYGDGGVTMTTESCKQSATAFSYEFLWIRI